MLMPYLAFDGQCEEAFRLYESLLGGQVQHISNYPETESCPANLRGKVTNATLVFQDGGMLSGGDFPEAPRRGDALRLQMHCGAEGEARRIFAALGEGGTVLAALAVNPPPDDSSLSGALVDRFGTPWILSCPKG